MDSLEKDLRCIDALRFARTLPYLPVFSLVGTDALAAILTDIPTERSTVPGVRIYLFPMGQSQAEITPELAAWIRAQKLFFVATAPLASAGHVNLSPKGLDSFRVLGPREAAYLDLTGSGAETMAHIVVEQVRTSCGWGVPLFAPVGDRVLLPEWSEKKGDEGLEAYRREKSRHSLDGLPAWAGRV